MSLKEKLKNSLGLFSQSRKNDAKWENWYQIQLKKLNNNEEIEPPWVAFPASSPIYGWNQGLNEEWKINVWMPFWRNLNKDEKDEYLTRWQISEEWRETLIIYWSEN